MGSNSKLLSSELTTHLTGRHNKVELYPFSFSEYAKITGTDTEQEIKKEGYNIRVVPAAEWLVKQW